MARKKIIAGNWKMNMTPSEAVEISKHIETTGCKRRSRRGNSAYLLIDIVPVVEAVKGSNIQVGAEICTLKKKVHTQEKFLQTCW